MHGRSTSLFSHVKRVLFALACNDIASVTVDNVDILQILDLICTNFTSLVLHLEWVLFAPAQAPAGLQQPIQHWLSLGNKLGNSGQSERIAASSTPPVHVVILLVPSAPLLISS